MPEQNLLRIFDEELHCRESPSSIGEQGDNSGRSGMLGPGEHQALSMGPREVRSKNRRGEEGCREEEEKSEDIARMMGLKGYKHQVAIQ